MGRDRCLGRDTKCRGRRMSGGKAAAESVSRQRHVRRPKAAAGYLDYLADFPPNGTLGTLQACRPAESASWRRAGWVAATCRFALA